MKTKQMITYSALAIAAFLLSPWVILLAINYLGLVFSLLTSSWK